MLPPTVVSFTTVLSSSTNMLPPVLTVALFKAPSFFTVMLPPEKIVAWMWPAMIAELVVVLALNFLAHKLPALLAEIERREKA